MFNPRVVKAQHFVRKMRGKTQAQLITADDGYSYVVKYSNNPAGRRILINELVSALLLKSLGVLIPEVAIVSLNREVLSANPEIALSGTWGRVAVSPGLHFGSRYPMERTSVYDFLPDRLLPGVSNRDHFLGCLVYDKWASKGDLRQAVFQREQVGLPSGKTAPFVATMIDSGDTFQGREWTWRDSLAQGLYPRALVYGDELTLRDFEPWLAKVMDLPVGVFEAAFSTVPVDWLAGDAREFQRLLEVLQQRRQRLPELLEESLVYINACLGPIPVAAEEASKGSSTREGCLAG
jgi:hypothetical protein